MKTNIYNLAGIILIVLATGCEKLVDPGDPTTTVTSENTFSSPGTANAALMGLYSGLLSLSPNGEFTYVNGGMSIYAGMSSDELVYTSGASDNTIYSFSINNLKSDNAIISLYFWQHMYKSIYNANAIIEGIQASTSNTISPELKKEIAAESKFIRAFNYFYLVNLFGDVPLVRNTDWKSNAKLSRSPKSEIYKLIKEDLIEAADNLPDNFEAGKGERIRVNKFTALALLSRIYLFLEDWKNAETNASLLIGNPEYKLEGDLRKVFTSTSTESIWQMKPPVSNPSFYINERSFFTPLMWWTDIPEELRPIYLDPSVFTELSPYLHPVYYMTPQLADAFQANDKRLETWTGFIETPDIPPYNGKVDRFPTKYVKIAEGGKLYITVLRLAEQFLIRAEARAQLNDLSGAKEDIDKIRERAGIENITYSSKENLLELILKERQTELFTEWGHRWFDLKRTGKAISELQKIQAKNINPNKLLYPIPQSEIGVAPNISQNPGY